MLRSLVRRFVTSFLVSLEAMAAANLSMRPSDSDR
jgi:hypothetical protein